MLDPKKRALVEAEAKRRGVDPAAAVVAAEGVAAKSPAPDSTSAKDAAPARPVADRLLVGFLPFIKVRELRAMWLGLPDSIPDDEMTCSEFALKHGGPVAPGPTEPAP